MVSETGRARILNETLSSKYKLNKHEDQLQRIETLTQYDVFRLTRTKVCLVFYCFSFLEHCCLFGVISKTDKPLINYTKNMIEKVKQPKDTFKYHSAYIDALVMILHRSLVTNGGESTFDCEDSSLGRLPSVYGEHSSEVLQGDMNEIQFSSNTSVLHDTMRNLGTLNLRSEKMEMLEKLTNPLKQLFNEFISPIKEYITEDEIIIVPHGILNSVRSKYRSFP